MSLIIIHSDDCVKYIAFYPVLVLSTFETGSYTAHVFDIQQHTLRKYLD